MIGKLKRVIFIAPLAILGMLLFVFIGGEIVLHLWNWLLPTLFGWRQDHLLAGAWDCWRCAGSSSADLDFTVPADLDSAVAWKSAAST